ncbi:MAG: GGDEF domain-containing phosphodiesterase [Acidimicrobiales bacterium]
MVFDQVPAWSVGAQLVVAGAAGVVLVDRGHRAVRAVDDRTSTWLAWFAFVLAAGLVVNVWVLSAPAHRVDQLAFVRSVLLIAAAVTVLPVAARLAGARVPRSVLVALAAVGSVRLLMWPVSDEVSAHVVGGSGALEYGSLVLATAVPGAVLVLAGLVRLWPSWDDRIERLTFATGLGGALAVLAASFVAAPAMAEALTGWGFAPLVVALVAVVVRRHRHRDEHADALAVVAARERARAQRLGVRGDLACEAAEAAWWELDPATGRFRAAESAWALLDGGRGSGADDGVTDRRVREGSVDLALDGLHADVRHEARHRLQSLATGAVERVRARVALEGGDRWIEVSARPTDAHPAWVVGIARDVTIDEIDERRIHEQRTRGVHRGGDGARVVGEECDEQLARGRTVRVLVVEVHGLDEIALLHGERAVGAALGQVLDRVAWARPVGAQVATLSDRHLVVLVPGECDAVGLATRIHGLLDRPVEAAGRAVRVSAGIGIAEGPGDGGGFELLVGRARAVAARSTAVTPTVRFDAAELEGAGVELDMATHVGWALAHDAIHVAFQPVVDARSGEVRSVEALVRCWHPVLGEVPTEHIVASAAAQGTALELFRTVLRAALASLRAWRDEGLVETVSVNVSPSLLADERTLSVCDDELASAGLPPQALVLEVTEHPGADDLVQHGEHYRARGIGLAIDDFGVGHSGAGRLAGLRVDVVKLDRSLVSGLDVDERRGIVVSLANQAAHALGASVVAEGVETGQEADVLRDAGVDALQGFAISRPLSPVEATEFLRRSRARRSNGAD